MASKIRIHRSTGASAPSSLEFGELAATVEQGTAGTSANKAGRIFIGNVAGNPVEIGGEYTYKLLDHTPGELHLSSAIITDANANINGLRVAGITTITRTDITDAVTQNLRVTGVGTFVAGLDLNGNVTIGNQHTDILTINSRTGVSTDMTLNNGLKVVGLSTFSNSVDVNATSAFGDDVTFETANTKNIVFDKSANQLKFGDNVEAKFGDGGDLVIFHNGSSNFILSDNHPLVLESDSLILRSDSNEKYLEGTFNGGVELYHNNTKKLETTATGVTISGIPLISTLTATRVPFVGSSKELVDNANFTFGSNVLNVVGRVDATDLDAGSNLRAVTGVVTNFTGTHNTLTHTVGTGATFTTSFRLGSGASDYSFPVARGADNQILILNGSGTLAFEDVPGTLVISAGYASTDAVELLPDVLTIAATTNETKTTLSDNKITVGLSTDIIVSGGATVSNNLHVIGNLKVDGTQTILNTVQVDVQDSTIGVGSTSTASNTTANGAGFFVHGGSDGNKEILYLHTKTAFTVNQHWLPSSDNGVDLGASTQEWKDLFIDGTATIDTLTINDAASFDQGADVTFNGASSKDMVWDSSAGHLEFADNAELQMGDGTDFRMYHNGSDSVIRDTGTGGLQIGASTLNLKTGNLAETYLTAVAGGAVTIRHDDITKFTTKTDGVDVTGELQCDTLDVDGGFDVDGGQLVFDASNNRLDFADDAQATFGDAQDLQFYHDQTNSVIANKTGGLYIKGIGGSGNTIWMQPKNNESSAKFNPDAGVELFFNNVEKFETTAYGINVTGTSETDTLIVTGVSTVASLIFSAGTNTNGVSYFDSNGQVQSTVSPASGISTSNSILTTNASGVPTWTDTIDCGTF